MHRLLKRQLKKACFDQQILDLIHPFLDQVDDAYKEFDNDLYHVETILEKSSQELFLVNQQLKNNVEIITSQLSKVANNIQEVIFEIDLNGNWSYLNSAWETLTGHKIKDTLGKPFDAFLVNTDGIPIKNLIDFSSKKFNSRNKKFQALTKDKKIKWFDFSVKCIKSEDDTIEGYIGTIVDITQLKKIESDLIDATEKATSANRAKDDFLSTMSHEIRTPLNAVVGISHLLLMENPKKRQLENLNALKFSSEHLLELLNDILDFNKITSGSMELENTDFDLENMLDGLQSIFNNKSKEKKIRFVIKKDNELPKIVKGDLTRLKQILANLINNAIKFTEKGKVILDVEKIGESDEAHIINFEIIDTGIGIAEDKIDKIFNSFSQAGSDTTRKYGGTGLGLAICKRLLEIMDSEFKVVSTLGRGSTFSFSLQLEKSEIHESEVDHPKANYAFEPLTQDIQSVKVLVAEDNKLNRLVIKKFLTNWNIDFDIAFDGEMALEKAVNNCYGLILMDLQMPKMDGFEASRAIRNSDNPLNKVVPIYALTASTGIDISHKIVEYGMNGIICKPFDPKDLYSTLVKIINKVKVNKKVSA